MKKLFADRYGFDNLSRFCAFISLPFLLDKYTLALAAVLLGYALFRTLSKNKGKRQRELAKFDLILYKFAIWLNKVFAPLIKFVKRKTARYKNRKTHTYIKCSKCKKQLRLPKNKGTLKVTCPECKNTFTIKT